MNNNEALKKNIEEKISSGYSTTIIRNELNLSLHKYKELLSSLQIDEAKLKAIWRERVSELNTNKRAKSNNNWLNDYSKEEVLQILQSNDIVSCKELGIKLQLTEQSTKYLLNHFKIKFQEVVSERNKRVAAEHIDFIIQSLNEGKSFRRIAKALNTSVSKVRLFCNVSNVDFTKIIADFKANRQARPVERKRNRKSSNNYWNEEIMSAHIAKYKLLSTAQERNKMFQDVFYEKLSEMTRQIIYAKYLINLQRLNEFEIEEEIDNLKQVVFTLILDRRLLEKYNPRFRSYSYIGTAIKNALYDVFVRKNNTLNEHSNDRISLSDYDSEQLEKFESETGNYYDQFDFETKSENEMIIEFLENKRAKFKNYKHYRERFNKAIDDAIEYFKKCDNEFSRLQLIRFMKESKGYDNKFLKAWFKIAFDLTIKYKVFNDLEGIEEDESDDDNIYDDDYNYERYDRRFRTCS